jgi:hypothetical protein
MKKNRARILLALLPSFTLHAATHEAVSEQDMLGFNIFTDDAATITKLVGPQDFTGLDKPARVNEPVMSPITLPLQLAAIHDKQKAFETLLTLGADPYKYNAMGHNTFDVIAFLENKDVYEKILGPFRKKITKKMNPAKSRKWKWALYETMQQTNSFELPYLKDLIVEHINILVPIQGGRNMPLLHLAAINKHKMLFQKLLAAGANPDLVDYKGRTTLQFAQEKGLNEYIQLLKAEYQKK